MKNHIIFLFFVLFSFAVKSQTPGCKKFRTGKFYYPSLPGKISWRKESTQESYNNGKLEMVWKVKWLSECEYEMVCVAVLVEPHVIQKGDRILATIVSTDGDCFTPSIIYYNAENPNGKSIPSGGMCILKD